MQKKFFDEDVDYKNIFEGDMFPQNKREAEQFITLCNVIQDHYICVDPMDQSKGKKWQVKE